MQVDIQVEIILTRTKFLSFKLSLSQDLRGLMSHDPGPVFTKGLTHGLGLYLRLLSEIYGLNFGVGFVVFTRI